jgi:uncharacterized protein
MTAPGPAVKQSGLRFGLISDTHGHLDPRVRNIFAGVDHIFHAGDIGFAAIVMELEEIAPTTAVLGNNDWGMDFKETESITVGGWKALTHHIVTPTRLHDTLQKRVSAFAPDLLVFGHSHKQFCEKHGDILFVNPGYSGKPRLGLARSVAIAETGASGLVVSFISLG